MTTSLQQIIFFSVPKVATVARFDSNSFVCGFFIEKYSRHVVNPVLRHVLAIAVRPTLFPTSRIHSPSLSLLLEESMMLLQIMRVNSITNIKVCVVFHTRVMLLHLNLDTNTNKILYFTFPYYMTVKKRYLYGLLH